MSSMIETLYKRKTIRSYTGEQISEEELNAILKSANASPVGLGKYETLHLTIVTNAELLSKIDRAGAKLFNNPDLHPLYNAPMLIVVSSLKPDAGMENVAYSNCAIVAHNMALTATELGVGYCYIWGATMAVSKDADIVDALGLPNGFVPCCAVALGRTTQTYTAREIPTNRIEKNYIS